MSPALLGRLGRGPRAKLLAAAGLVLLLALVAPRGGLSVVALARGLVALMLLVGTAWWVMRERTRRPAFRLREPLQVLSRQGLSPRCSVALLQADGQRFLVTYGDGFAQVQVVAARKRTKPRRAAAHRGVAASGGLQ